jgi:hypothetical protein
MPNRVEADLQQLLQTAAKARHPEAVPLQDAAPEAPDIQYLYSELGARIKNQAAGSEALAAGVLTDAINPVLSQFGKSFFKQVERACYNLLCDDADTCKKIMDLFATGGAATYIAGLLATGLGLAAPVATVVALLILKLFLEPAKAALCDVWKKQLPAPAPAK